MTKRHLSKQQKRRIDDAHQDKLDDATLATVIKRFGKQAMLELSSGELVRAKIRQNLASIVVGDRVAIHHQGDVVITALSPRKNELSRLSRFGQLKPLASNITQIILVLAIEPDSSPLLIDSYLVAASILGVKVTIVLNKSDLCLDHEVTRSQFLAYEDIGYPFLWTSKKDEHCVQSLQEILANEVSVFVGQSGVGKSTLIQKILPHEQIDVSSISEKQKLGRHTTTTAALYRLNQQSALIDSPGVREFFLHDYSESDLFSAFPELSSLQGQCQFRNCQHQGEKGCVLDDALLTKNVHPSRLNSFKVLLDRIKNE